MKRFLKIFVFAVLLPVLVVGAAVQGARWLVATRPQPKRVKAEMVAPLVRIRTLARRDERIWIRCMGSVEAARRVTLSPEVTGRIVEVNPSVMPGGFLEAGKLLVRLDDRDYRLAVDQAKAAVEARRSELKIEEGRAVVARREWEGLAGRIDARVASEDLALRRPQLANARAALSGAESGLARAALNVERCAIHVPFNAMVVEENVDVGEVVGPQTRLATLIGVDRFWVRVAVPVERLHWVRIPGASGTAKGSVAIIHQGNETLRTRMGHVLRLLGDLDPAGRQARLLVAVDSPMEPVCEGDAPCPPLLVGSYVAVDLEGPMLDGVVEVPRLALREGDRVWIADDEDRLDIRKVDIAWRRKATVLVRDGLEAGERLVVSDVAAPLPGMKLRILPEEGTGGKGTQR